jgi:mono/diheme cytochrome c family protein
MLLFAQADGAALFNEKCSMCHGAKGEGNKDAGMPAAKGTEMTAEKLTAFLFKGDPEKAIHASPMGQLNEEQAKAVAAFVKELK